MRQLVQTGQARNVRPRLLIAGTRFAGVVSAEIGQNSHYHADTFRLELALTDPRGEDLDWWGAAERVGELYDVRLVLDESDEQSFIIGEADDVQIHPGRGKVTISGRDLTRRFIDNRIQEAFQNKKSSEIVTLLAQRRGLMSKVTATTTPVQRFYSADHDRVQHDQFSHAGTEWDLISKLAQFEGFDAYVEGKTLYFQPQVDAMKAVEPYAVRYTEGVDGGASKATVSNLELQRSLTVTKDIVVEVRTWQSAHGKALTATSPQGGGGAVKSGKAQRFVFTRPNLTADQAQKEADRLREDMSRHERKVSFDCPGELDLTCRDIISLSGCGGWDQRYYIHTITRRISMTGGFMQAVTLKNHQTESQAS